MARLPGNPFYATQAGSGLGQLVNSLTGGAGDEAAAMARVAQSRLYGAQTDQIHTRLASSAAAAERLRGGDYSPENLAQVFADGLASADPQILQAFPGFIRGFGAAAGAGPERLAQLFVGAGGNFAHTQPGFDANEATQRRGQDVQAGTQRYGYDQQRAGALEREQLQETGRNNRTSLSIPNNADVWVGPNHPQAGQADPNGRIQGPRVPTGAGARPGGASDITPREASDLTSRTYALLGFTVDRNGALNGPTELSPDAQLWVQERASHLYKQSGDAGSAAAQAAREFREAWTRANPGVTPRTTAPGMFSSRTQMGLPANMPPPRGTAPAESGAPALPQGVPPGSAYSPSRRMWRSPDGKMFTEDGRPVS